jgi:hypothetical protein
MDIKERNKQIKRALLQVYKPQDVSVRGDTGTATGWVLIKVTLDRPQGCSCNFIKAIANWETPPRPYEYRDMYNQAGGMNTSYCPVCQNLHEKEKKRVNEIVHTCGAEFYHYDNDDMHGEESIIEVEIR